MKTKPHKWAKEIKAWADGLPIQIRNPNFAKPTWTDCNLNNIRWDDENFEFRIKPNGTEIELENGKYTIILEDGGEVHAYRYGDWWRELTGDNLVMALVYEVEELREKVEELREKTGAFDLDRFHDYVAAHCFGSPTSAGYETGFKLWLEGDDYATAAAEVVTRGLTIEPEE